MLVEKFKTCLGKSAHGGQSLYDHTLVCSKIAYRILTDCRFTPIDYPNQKRDMLLFSAFIHDIGKLDPNFQLMLNAARNKQPLPSKHVKHEASTIDYEQLLMETEDEIKGHLSDVLNYSFTESPLFEDSLAFAITHHGLFYLSFEQRDKPILHRIRREWTVFNYGEQQRVTFADLLFDYHPLGGLILIADLLGSFCFEQQIQDADDLISQTKSIKELIEVLLKENAAESVEASIQQYDPRIYGLCNLLILLAGGLM